MHVAPEGDDGLVDLVMLDRILTALPPCPLILGSFSAGSNVTGIASNTRALSRVLHAHGALSAFDYASAAACGGVQMATGVADAAAHHDIAMLSPHKFAGGPGSCGVLVMRRDAVRETQPHIPGAPSARKHPHANESAYRIGRI